MPDGIDPSRLQRSLRLVVEGRPKSATLMRSALFTAFEDAGVKEICALGELRGSREWFATLGSAGDCECVLRSGVLDLREVDLRVKIFSYDDQEIVIRLRWLPWFIRASAIQQAFRRFGEPVSCEDESVPGRPGCASLVRRLRLRCSETSKKKIPYTMSILAETALVLVPGRPPLCLRCNEVGHVRKSCTAEQCDICRSFNHTTEHHPVPSYASVLRSQGTYDGAPLAGSVSSLIGDTGAVLAGSLRATAVEEEGVGDSGSESGDSDVSNHTVVDSTPDVPDVLDLPSVSTPDGPDISVVPASKDSVPALEEASEVVMRSNLNVDLAVSESEAGSDMECSGDASSAPSSPRSMSGATWNKSPSQDAYLDSSSMEVQPVDPVFNADLKCVNDAADAAVAGLTPGLTKFPDKLRRAVSEPAQDHGRPFKLSRPSSVKKPKKKKK